MARTEKHFYECLDMGDIAKEVLDKYGSWFGEDWIAYEDIWFSLISGDQAKRSPDVYIDTNSKEWLKKQTKKKYCIAVWETKWDEWSPEKKQWKVFECLLKIAKVKPDMSGYSFMYDLLGWNWEYDSDKGLTQLPDLLEDDTKAKLQLPNYLEDDTDEDDTSFIEDEEGQKPKVKMLTQN